MTEQEDWEKEEEKEKEEEINIKEMLNYIKKLTLKDFIIAILIITIIVLIMVHYREIDRCNAFFNELLRNKTCFTSLW